MGIVHVDCSGLKYPLPVLRIAIYVPDMKPGDIMEVNADCDNFDKDLKEWCGHTGKKLISCRNEAGEYKAKIQF